MHVSPQPPNARRQTIADRLQLGRPVHSVALAQEFAVSEDAIRRDLRALAEQGLCRRVYGGALPLSPASGPFASRAGEDVGRKAALARAAAGLLRPGQTVFLDVGSTTLRLAEAIPQGLGLRVVTNSVPAAAALATRTDLSLVLVGGQVDPAAAGCVDAHAAAEIASLRVDLCVLGACALDARAGLAGFDLADVGFKRRLLGIARETAVMLTNEKLGTAAPFAICPVAAIAHLVLEHDAPPDTVRALDGAGPTIRIADAPSR